MRVHLGLPELVYHDDSCQVLETDKRGQMNELDTNAAKSLEDSIRDAYIKGVCSPSF